MSYDVYSSNVLKPVGPHTTQASLNAAKTINYTDGTGTGAAGVQWAGDQGCKVLYLQAFTQNVRITFDGTTPTATVGFQLVPGKKLCIGVPYGAKIQVIEEAASATVQYQWGGG